MTDKEATKLYKLLHKMYVQSRVCICGKSERYSKPLLCKLIDSDSPDILAVLVTEIQNAPILFTYMLSNCKIVFDCPCNATKVDYENAVNTMFSCLNSVCEVCNSLAEVACYRDGTMAITTSDGRYSRYVIVDGTAIEEGRYQNGLHL